MEQELFIINCKNYDEVAGNKIIKLVKAAEQISRKYKIKIAISPPQHLLSETTKYSVPILAQHVDDKKVGSTTGYTIPELIKKSGANGALINHSEHRIPSEKIVQLISRLKKLKMTTVVCVKNVAEAKKICKAQSRLYCN